MKVLIIGGTGNISSGITKLLTSRGHEITLFKRSSTLPAELSGVRVIVGDRTDAPAFLEKVSALEPFDCVIDMVCYERSDAINDVEAFRGRTKQLILCSTVDVYTKSPRRYPVTEENGKIGAAASFPYAYKKMLCEEVLWEAHSRGDFALTVMRPAFTYNDSWSPAIQSFGGQTYHLDRIRKGKPVILHGDGMTISVATYYSDAAAAFANTVGLPAAYGQAYNITGDEWMTQNHIWRTIADLLHAPTPDFVYIPAKDLARLVPKEAEWCVENFQYNNVFDNSKAKSDLGFRYTVTFENGAARCLKYLLSHDAIENCNNYPFYDRLVDLWRENSERLTAAMEG